ncbi:MAG: hypothetical protein PHY12_13405, partial [Eubacteriales bacterium]|nr:hypothetical protein [Eubacteriales bacterium]
MLSLRKTAALALTIALCLCALPALAQSNDDAARVVRVGYYPSANYQEVNANGNRSGFGYDYYMQMQKYTRWEYEFVEASYADCLKMLLS